MRRYRAPGLLPGAPELLRPSCCSGGRLKPVPLEVFAFSLPPALPWKPDGLLAPVFGWLPSLKLPLVLKRASPARPLEVATDAAGCFWASLAPASCGSCDPMAWLDSGTLPASKYWCAKTLAVENLLLGSHWSITFIRLMPSALDCGTKVSSFVGTNWGNRNPICAASLKPSGHWFCVGVPRTEQILYSWSDSEEPGKSGLRV
mmetsp:Transcript_44535/g.100115  ORF Transcript_44535/g.100115 Transcript_44535/m.100115 type:complete len:203 (-) Transcript_44535:651-1259(-)